MTSWDPPTGPIMVQRPGRRVPWAVALFVVAALLVGGALWARSAASDRSAEADGLGGDAARVRAEAKQLTGDAANDALSDPARTSEVIEFLNTAIEATFSYDYRDLAKTDSAVDKYLTGDARCAYNQLFDEVKQQAPAQKIVLATTVHELALSHLDKDDAEALVFVDQRSTRVDTNQTVAVGGQFSFTAHRDGDAWRITDLDLFDQPLSNGEPAPKC